MSKIRDIETNAQTPEIGAKTIMVGVFMAFSSSSKSYTITGTRKIEIISFNAASVTTGVASSKISHIDSVLINNETSGVVAAQKAAVSGQNITITGLNSNDVGTLVVFGY